MPKRSKVAFPLFADRIRHILDEENLKPAELARVLGVQRATVTEWLKSRTKTPRANVPFMIEDRLQYAARWVAIGEGEPKLVQPDPTDTVILENLHKLDGRQDRKAEVSAFIDFQVNRR